MKAISLTQPWAQFVALGTKQVETRSWATSYRGPLAIHAAKGMPRYARDFASLERTLGRFPARFVRGAVLCVVELTDCREAEQVAMEVSGLERLYGDYSPSRWAWMLRLVEVFDDPIPASGHLGLWEWLPPITACSHLDTKANGGEA